jgi:hypothetical protein
MVFAERAFAKELQMQIENFENAMKRPFDLLNYFCSQRDQIAEAARRSSFSISAMVLLLIFFSPTRGGCNELAYRIDYPHLPIYRVSTNDELNANCSVTADKRYDMCKAQKDEFITLTCTGSGDAYYNCIERAGKTWDCDTTKQNELQCCTLRKNAASRGEVTRGDGASVAIKVTEDRNGKCSQHEERDCSDVRQTCERSSKCDLGPEEARNTCQAECVKKKIACQAAD